MWEAGSGTKLQVWLEQLGIVNWEGAVQPGHLRPAPPQSPEL